MTCSTSGAVATYSTMADGFYFKEVPSGIKYWVGVCSPSNPSGAFAAGRYIDHKLANKEFDEEDFYITP